MSGKSDYYENVVLDLALGQATPSGITPHMAVFTASPGDAGGGTEVTGGSYARVNISAAFGSASGGTTSNTTKISLPKATANWGTVTSFGIYDAATGGNLVYWGSLSASKTIENGDTLEFEVGDLTITEN